MASTSSTLEMLVDQMARMSAVLADLQAGSADAMSARSRGLHRKLVTLFLDCRCSRHVSLNHEMFSIYKELKFPRTVQFGFGAHVDSVGIGTLAIKWPDGTTLHLQTTLYAPRCFIANWQPLKQPGWLTESPVSVFKTRHFIHLVCYPSTSNLHELLTGELLCTYSDL